VLERSGLSRTLRAASTYRARSLAEQMQRDAPLARAGAVLEQEDALPAAGAGYPRNINTVE
jgi:hypothetical protein